MLYLLSNIDNIKYFNCKPRFNGAFSKDDLRRVKDEADVINFPDKKSKWTNWISLFINGHIAVYFDSFGIGYIPQEALNKIKEKSITQHI